MEDLKQAVNHPYAREIQYRISPSASSPFLIVVVRRVSVSFIVCFLMRIR